MSDPSYSAPGADFLLAAEYVVGGVTYDAGEVLDGSSFPDLQAERDRRISEILLNIHQHKTHRSSLFPRLCQLADPLLG